ncbi:MAG: hypothetical protein ACRC2T_20360, partial [Thermoguttaceae bacterium]
MRGLLGIVFLIGAFIFLFDVDAVSIAAATNTADAVPLYEKTPFDRITLILPEGGGTFEVYPIAIPSGNSVLSLPRSGELVVRFLELPAEEYAVNWSAIEKIEPFKEIVFRELREKQVKLMQQVADFPGVSDANPTDSVEKSDNVTKLRDQLESIYGYFRFLFNEGDPPKGTDEFFKQFLFGESVFYLKCRDAVTAATRLDTLYAEQKDYPGISEQFGKVYGALLQELTQKNEYKKARDAIKNLESKFPDHPAALRWRDLYISRAKKLLSESASALNSADNFVDNETVNGNTNQAEEVRNVDNAENSNTGKKIGTENSVYDNIDTAWKKYDEAVNLYPDLPQAKEQKERLDKAASRTFIGVTDANFTGLLHKTRENEKLLFEPSGFDTEGNKYKFTFGSHTVENEGKLIRMKLNETPEVTAKTIVEAILRYNENKDVLDAVELVSPNEIVIRLRHNPVLPESLLQVKIPVRRTTKQRTHEIAVPGTKDGLQMLANGEISRLDRVASWEIDSEPDLQQRFRVHKQEYPTISFLVPNLNKPLPASRTFRRALTYAIDRQLIAGQLSKTG